VSPPTVERDRRACSYPGKLHTSFVFVCFFFVFDLGAGTGQTNKRTGNQAWPVMWPVRVLF